MNELEKVLNYFIPIGLNEMNNVSLQDRIDTKFLFNINLLPKILGHLTYDYKILKIKLQKICNYETLYFDTHDYLFYLQHHNGKLNRYKVRSRHYNETNHSFFEIKFKNNKNRTIKDRIEINKIEQNIKEKSREFLLKKTMINSEELCAKLWVYYNRITLVNNHSKERLTFDINLNFQNSLYSYSYPLLVIAEVKQEETFKSPFISLMKEYKIRPCSISKYCLGVLSLNKNIKQNNFKNKILRINKLCNE